MIYMNRIIFWSFVVLLSIPFAAEGQNLEPQPISDERFALPQLVLDETVYDAGEVKAGTRVSHDFIVSNRGTASLQIHKVSPG